METAVNTELTKTADELNKAVEPPAAAEAPAEQKPAQK